MRNVYIGGGGNNVGTRNPSWSVLRFIFRQLGIRDWTAARQYLREGQIDQLLKEWFWENRSEGFDYDHEELEGGRWYFEYLHPDEVKFNDGRVWKPIMTMPLGSPAEVMAYVEKLYLKVFGRNADQSGKEQYTQAILNGSVKREDLEGLLKQSNEYLDRHAETIRLEVPVTVDVKVTEDLIAKAMFRSKNFWDRMMPRIELGTFLQEHVSPEQWQTLTQWYFAAPDSLTLKQFIKKLNELTLA